MAGAHRGGYGDPPMPSPPSTAAHVLLVVGTRPEAIKLAPVVRALRAGDWARATVLDTGQHDDLVPAALRAVGLMPDLRVPLRRVDHSLNELLAELIRGLDGVLAQVRPDAVLVQGDTTSALAGALAAFHRGVPVGHVEAGLRSGTPGAPFPEEANRRMIAALARRHFAPTSEAAARLRAEGVPADEILVTGNTIVDELHRTLGAPDGPDDDVPARDGPLLLVTLHRRESLGAPLAGVLRAIARIAAQRPELDVWFPLHANPAVREPARTALGDRPGIALVDAADYRTFLRRLRAADLVLTDSGGVTEEATELGVRTLIVRDRTERPEAVRAGVAEVVGTGEDAIVAAALRALDRPAPPRPAGVFGDGAAGERIAAALRALLRPPSGPGVEVDEPRVVVED